MSRGVGERPSFDGSSPSASPTSSTSSCVARGTCTDHPLSRKWRLISPSIVGTAYRVKPLPRSGSYRSTALMRPTHATCTRSSSVSPAWRYRAASCRASGMKRSTSSSRASRSPSRWYRSRSLSSVSLRASGDSAAGSPNRTAGVTCHISPFRGDVKPGGASAHGGCVIHHLEPLLQAGDGEDALHRLGPSVDHEPPAPPPRPLVGRVQAGEPGSDEEIEARHAGHPPPAPAPP